MATQDQEKQEQMNVTSMVHNLVREGRMSPEGGADVLALRRELVARRERRARRGGSAVFAAIAVFVLGMFGVRRES